MKKETKKKKEVKLDLASLEKNKMGKKKMQHITGGFICYCWGCYAYCKRPCGSIICIVTGVVFCPHSPPVCFLRKFSGYLRYCGRRTICQYRTIT